MRPKAGRASTPGFVGVRWNSLAARRSARRGERSSSRTAFARKSRAGSPSLRVGCGSGITPGPTSSRHNSCPDDAATAPGGRYLVVVGDIYPHKNLETAIDAFSRLAPGYPDLALVFVGAEVDRAYAARMRARAAGAGLGRRVTFAGSRTQAELPPFCRRAACALSLSLAETFGITQVEALACGAPLVASDIPVAREICGDAAVLVPPRDPDAVAAAVKRVLDEPAWRAELGRRAIERAAAFTWD